MCGIVGYIGPSHAAPLLLDGLTRLEYRGYDSAGIAVATSGKTRIHKVVGRVRDLREALPARVAGHIGIGHTRWATHGPATVDNAHPHTSTDGRFTVVHNGIIDNAASLRAALTARGVTFTSETDTEVIAHLLAESTADTLEAALLDVTRTINGTYALAVMDHDRPDRIVVARLGSPLILGVGDKEMFVASDVAALVRHTSSVVHLDDGELATVTARGFTTFTHDNPDTARTPETIDITDNDLALGEHAHHMLKEILDQPAAARRTLQGRLDHRFGTTRLDGVNLDPRELRRFTRVKFLGCGSAYYVGEMGAQLVESIARIPSDAEPASEFRYRNPVIDPSTLYIAVSQSGETIDTAFAVQEVKRKGGYALGIVNVVGSTIARECHGGIYLHAGPEVSVASTKALTCMGIAMTLLAVHLGRLHDLSHTSGQRLLAALENIPEQIAEVIAQRERLDELSAGLADAAGVFYVGRVNGYPVAREGAQKLKEISYVHAEAYPTSELKHGPLALINPLMPTVAIVPDDDLADRNLAAVEQILARQGPVLAISHDAVTLPEHPELSSFVVPKTETELDPLLLTIPVQLLAYYAALRLGHDIDKPRNLAKSVTVE